MPAKVTAFVATLTLMLTGLALGAAGPVPGAGAASGGTVDLAGVPAATFTVTPGVQQVTVTGATPRSPLTLVDAASLERILTLYTDDLGQLTYQYIPADYLIFDQENQGILPTTDGGALDPGQYRIVAEEVSGGAISATVATSSEFSVLSRDDHPDPALYDQVLPSVPASVTGGVQPGFTAEDGYGYLKTRDGTLLSVNVRLPDPNIYGAGPYPTVIQYSGYAPSKPGNPSGADAGGFLAGTLGFAYVGVNVRGSGCSGGVFDVFNAAQAADGYDVVETVARQPWVKNGRPGMIGISYSGITQLYVAATRPPSLAAVTPLSVIEDPWDQQWPGGIYNKGFTQSWLASRDDEADGGAQWVKDRISGGDTTCTDNLDLRTQNIPFEEFARSLERRPADADDRNLSRLVPNIEVPVFLTGAWQDEQTGARFSVLLDDFASVPTGQTKFTMFNGHHPDGYTPLVLTRWFEFLSFYVDRTIPAVNPLIRAFAGPELEGEFGTPGLGFEPDRFLEPDTQTPTYGTYEASRAAYEQEQPVRVLFEVGASPDFPDTPGAQRQRFEMTFPTWPPGEAAARTFNLGPGGSLSEDAPTTGGFDRFAFDPDVLDTDYFVSGDWIKPQIETDWQQTADGKGLSYETAPLTEEMVVAGEGYLDLWLRSTGTDAPIEVVLSEVYQDPDPTDDVPPEEVRVQNGLLRAGYRTLDPDRSTDFLKEHLFAEEDYQPLTPGELVNVQVPLFAVAHPFRPGSRLRVQINTPGGDAPLWSFESDSYGATTYDVARGGATASRLVLPVLPSSNPDWSLPAAFDEQSERPPCGSLRGQPCRPYVPLVNEEVEDLHTANESFVIAAYADFLDREPSAAELADRAAALDDGTSSRSALVRTLATSDEWLGPVVDELYEDTLGRPADSSGKAFWVEQLRTRRYSVAQATAFFYSSQEFFTRAGGGTDEGWVTGLYQNLLGRSPDPDGLDYWVERTGEVGRYRVAHTLFETGESARTRVTRLYQALLGRNPEPAGLTFWSARVVSRGDIVLAIELASSTEYFTRAATRNP